MLNVVLDADGRVIACGETDSLVAPEGGRIIESDTDPLATLAEGQDAYWDGAKFVTRARQLSSAEQAFLADVATLRTYRTTAKANITPAQTVDAIWALIDMLRRVFRELDD